METRKLQIEISAETFAFLEMLAYGLHIENSPEGEGVSEWEGYDKRKDDFAPAVRNLIQDIAGQIATGVRRPGAWEREVVDSLTGWQGTFNRGMLADCIKDEVCKD
ncbi:hypothetical protein L1D52_24175 [Vibrio brasiliensis]|uniref:hypothetical protein n=1 Tax=Vibrio brasiliensis TaxID=170652 RepID=UPI001EFC3E10|nr:hypothetical protein [Vibrio brasiliensis]MCG9785410.1 hypothetical protein [Vibrio brasiliensis]